MSTLYLTALPDNPGMAVVKALRVALGYLGTGMSSYGEADRMLGHAQDLGLPMALGESDDPEAIKAARLALAEAGCTCAVDLPAEAREPAKPEPPTPEAVSYMAAQMALVALKLADGNPAMALHHCVLLGNAAGETPEKRRVFSEACGVLLDTFPPTLMGTIRDTIIHYVGFDPEGDSDE